MKALSPACPLALWQVAQPSTSNLWTSREKDGTATPSPASVPGPRSPAPPASAAAGAPRSRSAHASIISESVARPHRPMAALPGTVNLASEFIRHHQPQQNVVGLPCLFEVQVVGQGDLQPGKPRGQS